MTGKIKNKLQSSEMKFLREVRGCTRNEKRQNYKSRRPRRSKYIHIFNHKYMYIHIFKYNIYNKIKDHIWKWKEQIGRR